MPLFDGQAPELLEEIRRGKRTRRSTDQFLGVGGDGVLSLLKPAIIAMSWAAFGFLTAVARSAAKDVLKNRLTEWLALDSSGAPPLLPPDLEQKLRSALAAEFARGCPGAEPGDLVDRVVARIAPPEVGRGEAG